MIGRYANPTAFRMLLRRRDLARVILAGLLIASGLALRYGLADPPAWIPAIPLASLALTGGPILWGAVRGLMRGKVNVDELVSIAIVATLILGEFTSAGIVAFIMALGGLIEEYTSDRARRAVEAVVRESPPCALLIGDEGESEVPVESVCEGNTVRVRPGDLIPLDGEVIHGETSVDESNLTGEAMPVVKQCGDPVFAGTQNFDGCIDLRVGAPASESVMAKIGRLIEEAEQHRAPILRVAERYAQWFTPAILLLASGTWLVTGDPFRAVTVLIVGCPCAFVLATPTAVLAALGRAARRGILVKGGKFLEGAGEVDLLAFDKTGTLTEGCPQVESVWAAPGFREEDVLKEAAFAESGSEHPLGRAVVAAACARGIAVGTPPEDTEAVRGLGVRAGPVRVGAPRFLEAEGVALDAPARDFLDSAHEEGRIALFVSREGTLVGGLALQDKVRDEAGDVVDWCRKDGLETVLLTGDQEAPAKAVASRVGLETFRASLMPGDKQDYIRERQVKGKRIAYVGDGTNDGPALAEAHLGVSLASRRDTVALETADAVLMEGGLRPLPFLLLLGRRTRRTINQNLLLFGLAFNAAMLALSATGILTPILGALAHNAGSVLVVLNSARLLRLPVRKIDPLSEPRRENRARSEEGQHAVKNPSVTA
ncbi:MAG: heavy metal translocating P-type ATPase [Planctomycetota bacterium]|jgi:Cd2+/Zn2+-exporting ATPase